MPTNKYKPITSDNHKHPEFVYPKVCIKDVAQLIKRGASIRRGKIGELLVISPGCIRPMILDIDSSGRTAQEKIPKNSLTVEFDDVVLNNIGDYLGSAAVVKEAIGSYINQHVILIRPNNSIILSDYLALALNSAYVKQQIKKVRTGAIIHSLSLKNLYEINIFLPNMEIQQEIASKINIEYAAFQFAKKQYLEAKDRMTNLIKYSLAEESE